MHVAHDHCTDPNRVGNATSDRTNRAKTMLSKPSQPQSPSKGPFTIRGVKCSPYTRHGRFGGHLYHEPYEPQGKRSDPSGAGRCRHELTTGHGPRRLSITDRNEIEVQRSPRLAQAATREQLGPSWPFPEGTPLIQMTRDGFGGSTPRPPTYNSCHEMCRAQDQVGKDRFT